MEKLQPGQEKHPPRSCHVTAQKKRPRNPAAAPESDKDSGFSDVASDGLSSVEQTDSEECPPPSDWSTAENPARGPSSHPPPLLVLKNLLVDQGSAPDPHVQSWAVQPSFQMLPTSSQILLFPQSLSTAKTPSVRKKSPKYWPILNSYTKIAPHPSQLSSTFTRPSANKRGAALAHHSPAKRPPAGSQCVTAKAVVPETSVHKAAVPGDDGSCCQLGLTTPKDTSASCATLGRARAASSPSYNEDRALPAWQNKTRRFQNTLDILRRSGLLTIAMKTKELARANQATQGQLERLQEQVGLYTKAVCSSDPDDWQLLQDSLAGSHVPLKDVAM
ncbi:CLOCK-interacting pacemaker [Bufo gargarizans]|uniref:CLOCK-interacting pacemaker n=1 Tax=Bufo gargarizans TaxID=30331 RepID=UPI001CF5EDBC|nr:CLOCK-interacting pacemaker [Bufo gargarizans]XP_044130933.1 CLOCK-interacting pacemaker [Bufo gargarizans]XP_044130934.1 CLOCK-interacting pacemaker [Bufo gargarizans]